jgi:hypothetical protein
VRGEVEREGGKREIYIHIYMSERERERADLIDISRDLICGEVKR